MGKVINNTIGRIRKSVGQNNFYVRSGVQVVRLKPSFSPDRKFTGLQVAQQFRMKCMRRTAELFDFASWANCVNNANNRRYNASSKFNRMLGFMLKSASTLAVQSNPTDADIDAWIKSNLYRYIDKFAVGNIPNPIVGAELQEDAGDITLQLTISRSLVSKGLSIANRRRKPSNQYDDTCFYVVGWIAGSSFNNGGIFIHDAIEMDRPSTGSDSATISTTVAYPAEGTSGIISLATYIYSDDYEGLTTSELYSLFSSNNSVFNWEVEANRPSVQ